MGHQSYFIQYTGEDELEYIINVINEYQKIWFGKIESDEEIGEGIECICLVRITNPDLLDKYTIMFGINGGRTYCEKFFVRRGIYLDYYESEIIKNFEPREKWYIHKEEYFSENFSDQMYKLDFANWFTLDQREKCLDFIKKDKTYWDEKILEFDDEELSEIQREIIKNKLEDEVEDNLANK